MRMHKLAIAAAVLTGGCAGLAWAGSAETHVMALRLPDGQVAQVRYVGDVPPTVVLEPGDVGVDPAFALLRQMTAAMDRQVAAMFGDTAAFGPLPVMAGPGVCMRSVQITYTGGNDSPSVISRTAGDCGAGGEALPALTPQAPAQTPRVIEARNARPYPGAIKVASAIGSSAEPDR